MIILEKHNGITVLRDDLLTGGTKSILMPSIIGDANEFVYASPVYGGFQIALSAYCQKVGKKATIFCAKRKVKHKGSIHDTCMCLGDKEINIHPKGKRTKITDFEIIKESVVSLGYSNDY